MELSGPKVTYLYLCDKKVGACNKKTECPKDYHCQHTTNAEHAKNKAGRKFFLAILPDESALRIEYETEEQHEELKKVFNANA